MGIVNAEITIQNRGDVTMVQRGMMPEQDIRQITVTAMVDTGAATLVINEPVCRHLGLALEDVKEAELADGSKQVYSLTEPVQIQWKNRKTTCEALVVPTANEVLLGAIPLEAMDLIIHPLKQELIGAHGEQEVHILK